MTDKTPAELIFPDIYEGIIISNLPSAEEIAQNLAIQEPATLQTRKRRARELNLSLEVYTAFLMGGIFRAVAGQKRTERNKREGKSSATRRRQYTKRDDSTTARKPKKGTGVYPTPPINPMETGYLNPSYFDKFRRR
ncbi:hypothetical protein C4817_23755 [Salmonella enterica subsp. enterica serovar Newport]|uniref:hypothetical protein n=1 Tax=Salmonella enterica TaxID=28901 RepID=UPI000D579EEE|nr:hypothetical protein [Salmonella enterica]PVK80378.1 hypothetical protein C4817_23755 [Salmonella enterica subsp. enterica serovar Newport]